MSDSCSALVLWSFDPSFFQEVLRYSFLMRPRVAAATSDQVFSVLMKAFLWMRSTVRLETTKTGNVIFGRLEWTNLKWPLISRCWQDTRRFMGRGRGLSRTSGFQVMWLVAPLKRIHLSLRSWLMGFMLWACTHLIVCLPLLSIRCGFFFDWRNVIKALSRTPRFKISRFFQQLWGVCVVLNFEQCSWRLFYSGQINR